MSPQRIQRRRTKGWRMPEGAVYVGRPSRWGNPFRVGDTFETLDPMRGEMVRVMIFTPSLAVRAYAQSIGIGSTYWRAVQTELRGKDLACWCPLSATCHADVLLEIANA